MPIPHIPVQGLGDNRGAGAIEVLTTGPDMLCVLTTDMSGFLRHAVTAGAAPVETIRPTVEVRFSAAGVVGYRQLVKSTFHRRA